MWSLFKKIQLVFIFQSVLSECKLRDSSIFKDLVISRPWQSSSNSANKRQKLWVYHLLVPRFCFLGVCRLVWYDQRSGLVLVHAARLTEEQVAGPVPMRAASPAGTETRSPCGVSVGRHQGEIWLPATWLLDGNMLYSSQWCAVGKTGDRC